MQTHAMPPVSSTRPAAAAPAAALLLLLVLTALLAAADAASATAKSAPVNGVAVSVRSSRSVRHHGVQVPLFENTVGGGRQQPGRYFFPPLALLDCQSVHTTNVPVGATDNDTVATAGTEATQQRLLLTVLLWTDDFLAAARAQLAAAAAAAAATAPASPAPEISLELLPLTELTLVWSGRAARWLGEDFERRLRILGGWRDAQKPRARATFSVACERPADCRQLESLLGDIHADRLLDLRYRVRCDTRRRVSVPLASRHLLQSATFRQLRRFAGRSPDRTALATEATVSRVAREMREAALAELQERQLGGHQRAHRIDSAALAQLGRDAERLLRRSPLDPAASGGLSDVQWSRRVFWATAEGVRPDRLARLLNRLVASKEGDPPGTVRLSPGASALLAALGEEGELASDLVDALSGFLLSGHRRNEAIEVSDVCELADASLGGHVTWNASSLRFVPSPRLQLFELDTRRLLAAGIFAVRDAVLTFRVSEQRDHVTPECGAAALGASDFSSTSWAAQAELLRLRLRPLVARATDAATRLHRLEAELATARAATGPDSWVRERSGESAEVPIECGEIAELSSSVEDLSSRLAGLEGGNGGQSLWQGRFADSFCVLASYGPPPRGMTCRTMSFVVPKKSLRNGFLRGRTVRVGTGTAGQNLLQPLEGGKFYQLQLRGCCK